VLACCAAWIERQKAAGQTPCSPLTGLPLRHLALTPNRLVNDVVAALQAAAAADPHG